MAQKVSPAVPYFLLDVKQAFSGLSPQHQRYAHHLNNAGWAGALIASEQISAESPAILKFLFNLFNENDDFGAFKAAVAAQTAAEDFDRFVEYAAFFYSNLGNYLAFGDSKFIPNMSKAAFIGVAAAAPKNGQEVHGRAAAELANAIFSEEPGTLSVGFPGEGVSGYYVGLTKHDIEFINKWMTEQRIFPENTKVVKTSSETDITFALMTAAACAPAEARPPVVIDNPPETILPGGQKKKVSIAFDTFGQSQCARIAAEIEQAVPFASGDTQRAMLKHYVSHFTYGRIEEHREAQKEWVQDKGPIVESNIGFVETYRDPSGVRGEWSGWVSVVNKEQTKMYERLVEGAPQFISYLPWGPNFEKDTFLKPDFTSLELLGYAAAKVFVGICIPNYDDIRQDFGFKNVFLQNVSSAINFDEKMAHVTDSDWPLYKTHFIRSMAVNVALHELLGHGTGKLFQQKEDGSFNFDKGAVINPLTSQPVATHYKAGETWSGMFGGLSNAYEECRAEAVSLYLALFDDVLRVFGAETDDDRRKIRHVEWLNMCRAGLIALDNYSPETKQWRQAHARGRFCILQTLYRRENSIVRLDWDAEGGRLEISIDADRIMTDGKAAIGELLLNLNVNKSICDVKAGTAYYEELTTVDDHFCRIRDTVKQLAKPRKQFVQCHTRLSESGDGVQLLEFEPTAKGAIEAMVARHRDVGL